MWDAELPAEEAVPPPQQQQQPPPPPPQAIHAASYPSLHSQANGPDVSSDEWETVTAPRNRGGGAWAAGVPQRPPASVVQYKAATTSGTGATLGSNTTRAGERGAVLGASSVENARFSSGFIFGCVPETYQENMDRRVLGITKQHMTEMQGISPSSVLFLFNYKTKMLHGVFRPNGAPGLNLEPDAWKSHKQQSRVNPKHRADSGSPYPAQVRFEVIKNCEPLHQRVWGHIPTSKPTGYNQFELSLDSDQATKLARLFGV